MAVHFEFKFSFQLGEINKVCCRFFEHNHSFLLLNVLWAVKFKDLALK